MQESKEEDPPRKRSAKLPGLDESIPESPGRPTTTTGHHKIHPSQVTAKIAKIGPGKTDRSAALLKPLDETLEKPGAKAYNIEEHSQSTKLTGMKGSRGVPSKFKERFTKIEDVSSMHQLKDSRIGKGAMTELSSTATALSNITAPKKPSTLKKKLTDAKAKEQILSKTTTLAEDAKANLNSEYDEQIKKFQNPVLHRRVKFGVEKKKSAIVADDPSMQESIIEELQDNCDTELKKQEKSLLKGSKVVSSSSDEGQKCPKSKSVDQKFNAVKASKFILSLSSSHHSISDEFLTQDRKKRRDSKRGPDANELNMEVSALRSKIDSTVPQNAPAQAQHQPVKSQGLMPFYSAPIDFDNYVIKHWKVGDVLGAGNFGTVFRAFDLDTGFIFAVKQVPITSPLCGNCDGLEEVQEELKILQNLKYPHIVRYLGHEKTKDILNIFLEFISEGSIASILSKYGALEEPTIRIYSKQILLGLEYLHDNKTIHKDLKGANILVDKDGTIKLTDFGCSKQIDKTISNGNIMHALKGSIPWMAPEVVKQSGLSRKGDIWSFGCTLLEMATAKTPWMQYKFDTHIQAIMRIGMTEELPALPEGISDSFKSFILTCLNRNPNERPTAKELLKHAFLSE